MVDAIITAAILLIMLFLSATANAYEVTYNLAFRIGTDKNETIRVNDATYNGNVSTLADFSTLSKKYIASNRSNSVLALVFAGSAMNNVQLNTTYSSGQYLFQVRQSHENNRLLIAFTNGSWDATEDDLDEVDRSRIISRNFANILFAKPLGFVLYLRLEYADVDIGNSLAWSGIGKLRIRNRGASPPNVTFERV